MSQAQPDIRGGLRKHWAERKREDRSLLIQLLIGGSIIALTVAENAVFIAAAIKFLQYEKRWLAKDKHILKSIFVLTVTTLWVLAGLAVAVWMWAGTLLILGIFDHTEAALYFTMVTFTSLGLGDITLDREWRLLSGVIAANGLVLFSLQTAFLIEVVRRVRQAQVDTLRHSTPDHD